MKTIHYLIVLLSFLMLTISCGSSVAPGNYQVQGTIAVWKSPDHADIDTGFALYQGSIIYIKERTVEKGHVKIMVADGGNVLHLPAASPGLTGYVSVEAIKEKCKFVD